MQNMKRALGGGKKQKEKRKGWKEKHNIYNVFVMRLKKLK